jgi:aryl-alcohol dehydrogenase-like predicted oxidoreductase
MLCLGTGTIAHGRARDDVVATIRYAVEQGIRYVDTAMDYGSEPHVGEALAGRRSDVFLATKTLKRDRDGALRELDESLRNLRTDHVDLWQVHSLGHRGESPEAALAHLRAADGVMQALRRAKAQGLTKFIGFTGHTSPAHMLRVLAEPQLEFDTMLFILSAALARDNQRAWEDEVLPRARARGLGLIAMKVYGGGQAVGEQSAGARATPSELLSYVWDRGLPTANVGLYSKDHVDAAIAALRAYQPRDTATTQPARAAIRARFRDVTLPFEAAGYEDCAAHGA